MFKANLYRVILMLTLGIAALHVGSPANAQSSVACNTAISSAPTGAATVSTASTPFGKALVVGTGDYAGCSLYLLTSDELNLMTTGAEQFACSNGPNVLGPACDTVLWPALLTNGAPIAGPGVNIALLGTVTRTDVLLGTSVQQVTYAGLPLYRFFLDNAPGDTQGANLFDPVTSPQGIWYLVEANRGRAAAGKARLQVETAEIGGTGEEETVLAVTMDNDFSAFPNASFPVYALRSGRDYESGCNSICAAVPWPPVLTSSWPEGGPGVDKNALGIVVRPDGSYQVTYNHKPLYLFYQDAYITGITGTQGIYGEGKSTPWGVFTAVVPSP